MTITKEDVSAVIEKLVDNSLTFGCRILNKENSDEVYFNDGVFIDFIERKSGDWKWALIYDGDLINEVCEEDLSTGGKILGHPILLGNVLESLKKKIIEEEHELGSSSSVYSLMALWGKVGFTTSLQEIYSTMEWECSCIITNGRACKDFEKGPICLHLQPKPSPATNLFQLLISIFNPTERARDKAEELLQSDQPTPEQKAFYHDNDCPTVDCECPSCASECECDGD